MVYFCTIVLQDYNARHRVDVQFEFGAHISGLGFNCLAGLAFKGLIDASFDQGLRW